ncbi:MAG: lamin tail domain-containing protein, partial [Alphaproteobacteria bacterium]|nr:lamin tail domain-containing protein [Alphaproteobacteria bacterium]
MRADHSLLAALLLLGGCTDYDFYSQKHTDVFQQNQRNVVDILLVVDNSCSMIEEQLKLATNFDSFIQYFDGVDVDYQIAVITTDTNQEQFSGKLVGGDDEIILLGPPNPETGDYPVLDRVEYTSEWGLTQGVALSLDPSVTRSAYNDILENWCPATDSYGAGGLGTPGAANPSCGANGPMPDDDTGDSGADTADSGGDGARTPTSSDILISEIMADAGVDDAAGEWVELRNVSDATLDLTGCSLADTGRNFWTFPDGTQIAPGGYLVAARSDDSAANGGVEGAVATGPDFTLNDDLRIIRPDTPNADEIFAELVAQGISGSGIEMGLEAARMALSEPLLSGLNAGFLRDEANLAFIIVSDEDDTSPYPVDSYLRFFTDLKGEEAYRNHQRFSISSVVGD